MFGDKDKPKTPKKVKPTLVCVNLRPERDRVTYSTRQVFGDLCAKLEEFEAQGWEVHTVAHRHNVSVGDHHWVLLRKPGNKERHKA